MKHTKRDTLKDTTAIKQTKLDIIKSNEGDEFTVSTIANICTRLPQHH